MITKDFDNEFEAIGAPEFTLCGQTFHGKEHVPYSIWRTLMRGDQRVTNDTPRRRSTGSCSPTCSTRPTWTGSWI
jgi:hypothetical protein